MSEMKNMSLAQIAAAVNGTLFATKEQEEKACHGVVIDSRQVQEGYLFVAIHGEKVDGHTFIPSVFEKGALAVVSEQKLEDPKGAYILVGSTETALKELAAYYRRQLDLTVVGITGSVGKTSTKEMIASVLEQKYQVLKTAGNFNNEIGLPLTIFRIRKEHEVAVLEMGISDFNEMHRLSHMAMPDICVITNIGLCHLENLKTRDGILRAKTECFEHMKEDGSVILNGNDDKLSTIHEVHGKSPVFYGISEDQTGENGCKLSAYATDLSHIGLTGMRAVLHVGDQQIDVEIPISGEHHVMNALAAFSIGKQLGLTMEEMKRGVEQVETISGHSNLIQKEDLTIMDDCYNANPVSMRAAIDVLAQAEGRKVAVLGDMGELGSDERAMHYGIGEYLAEKEIDVVFLAGELMQEAVHALKEKNADCELHAFATRDELQEALPKVLKKGDSVLVKASHFMGFSKIVEELVK